MSNVLRSLLIKVGVDLTDAQKGFKQAAKEFKANGKAMTELGKTLTVGVTVPVLGAAAASVKYASDMEESLNKVRVAFKDSSGDVETWSKTTLKSFGMAKGTALDMAATYGDMATAMGLVPKEAATMSTSLSGLAGDLASFKNIDVQQASEALRGVFTGEGEALKTLGIVMQDSTLQAYALAQGYQTAYKDMSQAEKVTLRYKYVMETTKNAQGDFSRTSGGVANQMRIVQESLKETAATMGESMLPTVAKALKSINGLIEGFANLDDQTRENIMIAGAVAAAIGPVTMAFGKLNTGIADVLAMASSATKAFNSGSGLLAAIGAGIGPAGMITLAVTAVGALAAGLYILYNKATETERKIKEFSKTLEASAAAYKNSTQEVETNSAVVSIMADELFDLENKEKKTNAEKLRMTGLIEQLNELMPELNLQYNEQTGLLNSTRKAVTELIEAKKKEAMFAVHQERLTEAYKEQLEVQEKNTEAVNQLKDAYAQLDEAQRTGVGYGAAYSAITSATEAVDGWAIKMIEAEQNVNAVEKSMNDLAYSVTTAYDGMVASGENRVIKTKEQLEEEAKAQEEYNDRRKELYQNHIDQMGALSDAGIEKSKLTAAEVKKNLELQILDFQNWQGSIATLSARVPSDVMDGLRALGPSALPMIDELNRMSNEKLAEWVEVWRKKGEEAAKAAQLEMDIVPQIGTQAAADLSNDLIDSLDEHQSMINEKYKWSGHNSGTSYADGIREKLDAIKLAADEARMTAKDKIQESYADFNSAGLNASLGFAAGIREKIDTIRDAARETARAAAREMRLELAINSPSKVTEAIGGFTGLGFIKGITGKTNGVKSAAAGLANALANNLATDLSLPSMSLSSMSTSESSHLQPTAATPPVSTPSPGIDYERMARAVASGLQGMGISFDNREVARMVEKSLKAIG